MGRAYLDYDEDRQRMIDEVSYFITWGLRNPDKVRAIPTRPVGSGAFSERLTFVFWTPILGESISRPISWLRSLLGR